MLYPVELREHSSTAIVTPSTGLGNSGISVAVSPVGSVFGVLVFDPLQHTLARKEPDFEPVRLTATVTIFQVDFLNISGRVERMIFARNFANYEKLLQQKYEVSTTIRHKGERGRQRENGLMMFLRETLPAAYGVATGEIFPSVGNRPSPQCDIIVYDKLRTPIFGGNEAVQQIPLDWVYAVIETKSVIDTKALSDAKRKFGEIKNMPRCSNRVRLKRGFKRRPVFYLFGYKLAASKDACMKLVTDVGALDETSVVALNSGLTITVTDTGRPDRPCWLNTSEQEAGFHETLMYFFVCLLRDLESIDLGVPDLYEWVGDRSITANSNPKTSNAIPGLHLSPSTAKATTSAGMLAVPGLFV